MGPLVSLILAVEPLPLDLAAPGAGRPGLAQDSQVMPLLLAALLVTLPLALLLAMRRPRQRKHMTHRPRNPTLAETGGLPPPRQP